ncbi:hypothetical protein BJ508DRAFT_61086 [Ascobolus immersus RN42]|uniref:Uncharacterized protein n=1 Tax=Ascobolus immersus RN42 TaxID=1160509 RepID=A0A3N4ITK0_ASCIM|nr:hypothetical protein BJ508DRAFT_61086 [Ascobolus immersus RN42]
MWRVLGFGNIVLFFSRTLGPACVYFGVVVLLHSWVGSPIILICFVLLLKDVIVSLHALNILELGFNTVIFLCSYLHSSCLFSFLYFFCVTVCRSRIPRCIALNTAP